MIFCVDLLILKLEIELPCYEAYDDLLKPMNLFIFVHIIDLQILTRFLESMLLTP